MTPAEVVYREAELLDAARYDEWLALFADDARYWIPLSADQTDAVGAQSLACEDRMMLRIRIERLKSGKAYSHQPPIACRHVLQAPAVAHDLDTVRTHTPFLYIEARGDEQVMLAGVARHTLRAVADGWLIVEKRVDLLNASAALPTVFLLP